MENNKSHNFKFMSKLIDLKQHFWAVLATFLIAGSFISSEILSDVINPISLTLLRFFIATLALLPIVLFKRRYRSALGRALPRYLLLSLFFAIFFIIDQQNQRGRIHFCIEALRA